MESFEITRLGGATIRFKVNNLTDVDGTAITSGGNVTINLYDKNDELVETGTVTQDPTDTDSYYCDINLPAVTRVTRYTAKASASKSSRNYRDVGVVWVVPF